MLSTASTAGASGARSVTYRLNMEHSAGVSPFRETTITVEPMSIPADGVSTGTITVQLRDPVGNPPSDAHVLELFTNSQWGTIGPVTDLGEGRFTATLTVGTTPGVATVVGMVDFLDLDLTAGTVTLTPATSSLQQAARVGGYELPR